MIKLESKTLTTLAISLIVIVSFYIDGISSQECRSYQGFLGNCVSIKQCPPLFFVLTNNPNAGQLRALQRLTCGFESGDPKVCCPVKSIKTPDEGNKKPDSPMAEVEAHAIADTHPKIDSKLQSSTEESIITSQVQEIEDLSSHPGFKKLPIIRECGVGVGNNRIIGGKNTSHGVYPWMARVGYKSPTSGQIEYHCGGTIISKRFLLTAAHCVEGTEEFVPISIRLGEHDTLSEEDCNQDLQQCSKVDDYTIKKIISHPEYNGNSKQNDIALIMVDRDINFGTIFIHPVCLPFTKEYDFDLNLSPESFGIVAGFGKTKWNNAGGSTILQEVTLPLKTKEECQTSFGRRVSITDSQLCAGGEHGKDSCGGDSGGPLMISARVNRIPRIFQLGVVSFGPTHCGLGGLPGVYARTTSYLKWILDSIENSST